MKRSDLYLVLALVFVALSLFAFNRIGEKSGGYAVIYVENKEYKRLPLSEDTTLNINGKNTVTVKDGQVFMESADCPDQLCVHQKPLKLSGRDIVCLPNRVTVRVIAEKEVDGMVQ